MAKAIKVKSVAVSVDDSGTCAELELYLDNSGTELDADFSVKLHTGNTTIPMLGITPQGRVTLRYAVAGSDGALSVDITATEAGGTATTKQTTPAALAALGVGDSVGS